MPRGRPAASGYARLAQADEEEEEEYHEDTEEDEQHGSHAKRVLSDPTFAPIQPGARSGVGHDGDIDAAAGGGRSRRRKKLRDRANSGVDIKALNARLERWAEEIAAKFKIRKIKGKSAEEERLEIHHSVFQAPDGMRPANSETLAAQFAESANERLSKLQFDDIVESVKVAIELGVHPKLITQGSSGSYFARNSEGRVLGVFKPKDEEPYASRNPKWTKWIHRNLFPFFFGRACLIPNLSYVSEAAAYVLDMRLQTNIVPYTDVVYLSSPAFFYDYWERRNFYRKKKPLPMKPGSFQVFLQGFQDATVFLKKHPWPDQTAANLSASSTDRRGRRRRWADQCRPGANFSDDEDEEDEQAESEGASLNPGASNDPARSSSRQRRRFWTEDLQQSFREELEKLVILDYIMRNTDRGLDNWMIKIDQDTQKASLVVKPPRHDSETDGDARSQSRDPYGRRDDPMSMASSPPPDVPRSQVKLGAIDNSLSWPWKHPDAWRSYPFGWLFLPVSLIGRPFSEKTRQHFLPILTSKQWWSDTQVALRQVFSQDSDFQERMFARQIAVMKGQAWNVVETLKQADHGPLELTRRARVCVWDDLVEIPVAVPMRNGSEEMRRRHQDDLIRANQGSEIDITSGRSYTVPEIKDASLGLSSPDAGALPNPRRFSLSRSRSRGPSEDGPAGNGDLTTSLTLPKRPGFAGRSNNPRANVRVSLDDHRPRRRHRDEHRRNFSFSARRMSDHEPDDEDDGDLGFAVARDMEGHRRKVIVERLEMVKSKPPVFTWC